MKAMKNLGVNRMLGSVRRRASPSASGSTSTPVPAGGPEAPPLDTPEENAQRSVRLFCESGGPGSQPGEEVLYLPTIVEAAESSPAAAKECALQIRKFLSKDMNKPHIQYNAIMLTRILADNPGPTFTKNIDQKFVSAVKDLLRIGRDGSVKQILIETLDNFEREKKHDENLVMLMQMWRKEQVKMSKIYGPKVSILFSASYNAHLYQQAPVLPLTQQQGVPPRPSGGGPEQNYFSRSHHQSRNLPAPAELASRLEEAKTSAKLLTQLVQSTPSEELMQNDLIREFANRCQSASRSIQGYMVAENPPPDNDTMLTLIETNEQLALAQTKHQRAILNARKALGIATGESNSPVGNTSTNNSAPAHAESGFAPPPGPPPSHNKAFAETGAIAAPASGPPVARPSPPAEKPQDPFADPSPAPESSAAIHAASQTHNQPFSKDEKSKNTEDQFHDRLGVEPYHPGFNPTQSYMGRQDSSVGKVTMHAAIPDTNKELYDDDEEEAEARKKKPPVFRY